MTNPAWRIGTAILLFAAGIIFLVEGLFTVTTPSMDTQPVFSALFLGVALLVLAVLLYWRKLKDTPVAH